MKKFVYNAVMMAMAAAATMLNPATVMAVNPIDSIKSDSISIVATAPEANDFTFVETTLAIEPWMSEDINLLNEETLSVEPWMSEDINLLNEETLSVESWMSEDVNLLNEETLSVESWMSEDINLLNEETLSVESWMMECNNSMNEESSVKDISQICGEKISEERIVETFSKINISSFANVVIVTGKPQKVIVSGDSDFLSDFVTEVKGGELFVHYRNELFSPTILGSRNTFTVEIWVEKLTELKTSGAVSTRFPEPATFKRFKVVNSGATKLSFNDLEVKDFFLVDISGASSIDINGRTFGGVKIDASGASKVMFSGNVENLDIEASGAGNINLSGYADEVNVMASGASKVSSNKFSANKKSFNCTGASSVSLNH